MLAAACSAQTPGSAAPAPVQPPPAPAAQSPAAAAPQVAPKPSPAPTPADTAAKVDPAQPVITVNGVCSTTPAAAKASPAGTKSSPAGASCKTIITKTQFEKLLKAVNTSNQNISPAMRRNLAQAYVELMTFNQAAQKAGVDKDPDFLEVMKLVRMRTLQDFYRRKLEEKYRTPPPSDVEAYYNQNLPKYEEIKLSRLFIPAKNPSSPAKDDWEKKAAQEADDIHDRAVKGEDFEKLQKEAYTTLELTITPPATSMGTRRRGMMVPDEEKELFGLKPGEISKLEKEPAGYIIYKVESKQTLPLEKVKDEISREVFRQKMESQMKSVTSAVHADFNDVYFGPATPPPSPAAVRPLPPGAREPQAEAAPKPGPAPATPPK